MPIKFACPQCKNVMTVDSKFAGKKGKCNKCGSVVEVPAESAANAASADQPKQGKPRPAQPRPVHQNPGQANSGQPASGQPSGPAGTAPGSPQSYNAAPPPSAAGIKGAGPLGHVFDELTESDYNRSSPYQNVYAPPKKNNEGANPMLIHAAKQEQKAGTGPAALGADGRPKLTVTIIIFAVLDILESLAIFAMTLALAIAGMTAIPEQAREQIPFLGAGIAIAVVICGLLATTLMASGLGLLTKQVWGYFTALFVYSFQLGFRIMIVISAITDWERVVGPIVSVLLMASITGYLFQEECRRVYGVSKKSKLPLIVGGIGLGLSLGMGGLLFLLGVFASAVAGDQPLPP